MIGIVLDDDEVDDGVDHEVLQTIVSCIDETDDIENAQI